MATPKQLRQARKGHTLRLLEQLSKIGVRETEIAFKTNASIQSVWLWAKGRVPSPAYFDALVRFAKEKGIDP